MRTKRYFLPVLLTILALALVIVYILFQLPYTYHGSVIEPPLEVDDFVLETENKQTFRLSDQRGKIVLLFFGYTSCPDVCPITLAEFTRVYAQLGNDVQQVRFVMITADPERDTPEKIASYTRIFNPNFIGLSGERTALEKVWKQFGVFIEKQDTGSAAGYLVSHTSSVYVIDWNGNLRMTFPYGTLARDIVADLKHLLKEK